MKTPSNSLPLTVKALGLVLLHVLILLILSLPNTNASPSPPMDHNDPNWWTNYGQYGHPGSSEQNPPSDEYNPDHFDVPSSLRLNLPGSASFQEDDALPTSRATPRSLQLLQRVRRLGGRRSGNRASSHADPETPHNIPPLPPSGYHQGSSSADPSNYGHYPYGGSSSSYGTNIPQVVPPSSSYSYPSAYEHGGGSSSHGGGVHYSDYLQTTQEMMSTMNVQEDELPIQADTEIREGVQRIRTSRTRDGSTMTHRSRKRQQWESQRPDDVIPLRLLKVGECHLIGVPHSTLRYEISIYLEDQYLRKEGVELGPLVPPPLHWQGHKYPPLVKMGLEGGVDDNLKRTQNFLDYLFAQNGLLDEAQQQAARTVIRPEDDTDLTAMDRYYREWTAQHGNYLVPLRFMGKHDLKAMGLTKGGIMYQAARWAEEEEFTEIGRSDLCSSRRTRKPDIGQKFTYSLSETHMLPADSYLEAKQAQVDNLLRRYGFLEALPNTSP